MAYASANASSGAGAMRRMSMARTSGAGMACCLANPFHPSCRGMKLPDGQNGRSLPMQVRGQTTLIANANGKGFEQLTGSLPACFLVAASETGGVYTLNATRGAATVPAIFTNFATLYRIVCWGVHITCTSPVTSTGGSLILTTTNSYKAVGSTYTSGVMDGEEVEVVPLATGCSYVWTSRPLGPRVFVPPNTTAGTETSIFTTLIIDMLGAVAGATTINIEYVFNIECQVTGGTGVAAGLEHLAPKDPPPMPKAIEVAAATSGAKPSVIAGAIDVVGSKIESVVKTKAASFVDDLFLEGLALLGL